MCSLSRGHIGLPNDVNTVSYFVGAERTHISQRETFNNAQRYISTFYYLYMPLSSRISMLRHSSISQPRTVLTVTCFASNCAQILVSFLCKHCRCQAIKHSGEHERWNQALRLWREHPADWLDGKLVRRYSLLYGCKFSLPLLTHKDQRKEKKKHNKTQREKNTQQTNNTHIVRIFPPLTPPSLPLPLSSSLSSSPLSPPSSPLSDLLFVYISPSAPLCLSPSLHPSSSPSFSLPLCFIIVLLRGVIPVPVPVAAYVTWPLCQYP